MTAGNGAQGTTRGEVRGGGAYRAEGAALYVGVGVEERGRHHGHGAACVAGEACRVAGGRVGGHGRRLHTVGRVVRFEMAGVGKTS